MGAVLSSIPLCSRQGQDTGDNKPEERQDNQAAVLAQPQSVHQQVSRDLHTYQSIIITDLFRLPVSSVDNTTSIFNDTIMKYNSN